MTVRLHGVQSHPGKGEQSDPRGAGGSDEQRAPGQRLARRVTPWQRQMRAGGPQVTEARLSHPQDSSPYSNLTRLRMLPPPTPLRRTIVALCRPPVVVESAVAFIAASLSWRPPPSYRRLIWHAGMARPTDCESGESVTVSPL